MWYTVLGWLIAIVIILTAIAKIFPIIETWLTWLFIAIVCTIFSFLWFYLFILGPITLFGYMFSRYTRINK